MSFKLILPHISCSEHLLWPPASTCFDSSKLLLLVSFFFDVLSIDKGCDWHFLLLSASLYFKQYKCLKCPVCNHSTETFVKTVCSEIFCFIQVICPDQGTWSWQTVCFMFTQSGSKIRKKKTSRRKRDYTDWHVRVYASLRHQYSHTMGASQSHGPIWENQILLCFTGLIISSSQRSTDTTLQLNFMNKDSSFSRREELT